MPSSGGDPTSTTATKMYLLAAIELDLMRRLGRNHQRLHEVGSGPGLQYFVDHHL